ncbi:hypothetical protein ACRALDRAFT_211218 [Sodiomyces alcalophilus JCM 7366]|uniref:uncharacterized protein n=1 Tax=Sodiomyces alcalophilus JCM 7366 TaxID=591952 RepID=UPI0039B4AC39
MDKLISSIEANSSSNSNASSSSTSIYVHVHAAHAHAHGYLIPACHCPSRWSPPVLMAMVRERHSPSGTLSPGIYSVSYPRISESPKPKIHVLEDGPVLGDSTTPGHQSSTQDGAALAEETTGTTPKDQEVKKKQKKTPEPIIASAHDIWRAQSIYLESSYFTQNPVTPITTSKKARLPSSSSSPPPSSPSLEKPAPPTSTIVINTSPSRALAASTTFFASHPATHLYSASTLRTHRRNSAVPEIALVGASNCGKSSFLNALVRQPGLARTSARAGHTTSLNAYGVGPAPSAKEGAKMKARVATAPRGKEWGEGIVAYLRGRTMLRGVVCLVAVEKDGVSRLDQDVLRMVASLGRKVVVVLTKGDKLVREAMAMKAKDEAAEGKTKKKKSGKKGGEDKSVDKRLHAWTKGKMVAAARAAVKACRDVPEGALVPRVYLTAAEMVKADGTWKTDPRGGNRGMAGVRLAILDMADMSVQAEGRRGKAKSREEKTVEDVPAEARSKESTPEVWAGETISFEELEKMSRSK